MIRYRDAVMPRLFALNHDVTADLMHLAIAKVPAQQFDEHGAIDITRQLHATARTSSRTKCKRMLLGLGWSKK